MNADNRAKDALNTISAVPILDPDGFIQRLDPDEAIEAAGRLWDGVIIKTADPYEDDPYNVWLSSTRDGSGSKAPAVSLAFDERGWDSYSDPDSARAGLSSLTVDLVEGADWVKSRLDVLHEAIESPTASSSPRTADEIGAMAATAPPPLAPERAMEERSR